MFCMDVILRVFGFAGSVRPAGPHQTPQTCQTHEPISHIPIGETIPKPNITMDGTPNQTTKSIIYLEIGNEIS